MARMNRVRLSDEAFVEHGTTAAKYAAPASPTSAASLSMYAWTTLRYDCDVSKAEGAGFMPRETWTALSGKGNSYTALARIVQRPEDAVPGPLGGYSKPWEVSGFYDPRRLNSVPATDFDLQCMQKPDRGSCNLNLQRWWYNTDSEQCEIFDYGGCGGNENVYKTKDHCEITCMGKKSE
ncbi:hypothetical protein HPB50_008476 [Hyalomma asiaticum]|uniref:Uncharacterized protein n=1 Tax=Hyalomma asiaticum TaxID=266040 RepID=A0ACB7RV29_HYAAI|nr:hypothetical protein HPB50_008476 [Hyalomma asiaticum]